MSPHGWKFWAGWVRGSHDAKGITFRAIKVGQRIRFRAEDVDVFLRSPTGSVESVLCEFFDFSSGSEICMNPVAGSQSAALASSPDSEKSTNDVPLTVREAALYLGVSSQTVYLWV